MAANPLPFVLTPPYMHVQKIDALFKDASSKFNNNPSGAYLFRPVRLQVLKLTRALST